MKSIMLLIAGVLLNGTSLLCQVHQVELTPRTSHIIYGEVSSLLFVSWASVNYERMINEKLSLRGGLGLGYTFIPAEGGSFGYGPTFMLNYFPVGEEYRLELGAGVAAVYSIPSQGRNNIKPFPFYFPFPGGERDDLRFTPHWWIGPAVSIGYRYQPKDGGFFFRAGATLTNLFGFPFQVSFGHTW
jgi:hypothetical protein